MRLSVCACFRCVRASDVCAWNFPSIFYARLVHSGSPYIESWYVRLNENSRVGGNAQTDIMWKCGRCQNKVPFYTTDIDILRVASMHRIVIHCIDISMNRYTPNVYVDKFIWKCITPKYYFLKKKIQTSGVSIWVFLLVLFLILPKFIHS